MRLFWPNGCGILVTETYTLWYREVESRYDPHHPFDWTSSGESRGLIKTMWKAISLALPSFSQLIKFLS